jgi:pyruvate-ferredoxin/flavodoxin oxidoreductase
MELPLTFADFAVTEARFRKQFRTAPRDTWNENMISLAEYLELSAEDREGKFPFIWGVNTKNRLIRVIPAAPIVLATEDRRNFWRMMKSLTGLMREKVDEQSTARIRAEFAQEIASRLMLMVDGSVVDLPASPAAIAAPTNGAPAAVPNGSPAGAAAGSAAWIDSALCTACDECTTINPRIFAYDDHRHAYVKDPKGGPFKDVVKAAEKCTAQVIHPGSPLDPKEKDLEKLIKRAAKYN